MSRPLPLDLLNLRVSPIPEAMSFPPTITRGVANAASTINGASTTTAAIQPNSAKLTPAHGVWAARASHPTNFYEAITINYGGGTRSSNYMSVRFMTDAPEFDFALREAGGDFTLWVDGQPISRGNSIPVLNLGDLVYHKASFGADVLTYIVEGSAITAGGSGYVAGDTITLTGGTGTQAQFLVSQVSSGAVSQLRLVSSGDYSAVPTSPVAQGSTSGAGTGFTCTPIWGQKHTTRKMRRVEFAWRGNLALGGINVPAGCTVLPWPVAGEKWLWVGDSFTENTYSINVISSWDDIASQALGVFEGSTSYGIGSVGYAQTSGSRPNFLGMVPDLVALAPTRMVVALGINDLSQPAAAIIANVSSAFGQLLAQLPNCLFFCLGPWSGKNVSSSTAVVSTAIRSGFEAVVPPSRGVFLDVVGDGLIQPDGTAAPATPGTGNTGQYTASDNTHPASSGQAYLGYGAANGIVRATRTILAAA